MHLLQPHFRTDFDYKQILNFMTGLSAYMAGGLFYDKEAGIRDYFGEIIIWKTELRSSLIIKNAMIF